MNQKNLKNVLEVKNMNKTARIGFAVTPANKIRIKELAESYELTVSAYVRACALGIRNNSTNFNSNNPIKYKNLKPPKTPVQETIIKRNFRAVMIEMKDILSSGVNFLKPITMEAI